MSSPDISALPAQPWRTLADIDLSLHVPAAGVLLGADRGGNIACLPAIQPRPVRIGLVDGVGVARLVAHRLLAVGCQVTVYSQRQPAWQRLWTKVGGRRMTFAQRSARWPGVPAGPRMPQALVLDAPEPPANWIGDAPWCTVIHVANRVPTRSEFWRAADVVVVCGPGHGEAVLSLRNRPDAALADELRPGEVALCGRAGTTIVRLDITPAEMELVTEEPGPFGLPR
ncbi:MAG TPA: hypothetical protein VGD48_31110 [Kutzneria sp.]|jgi:hypothetical protein